MVEETLYIDGYRLGMFDKCNGRERRTFTGWSYQENQLYLDGYADGYDENERKIG